MIVCVCNNISDKDVLHLVEHCGVRCMDELRNTIPICDQCETCKHEVQDILNSTVGIGGLYV